ncbi:winged helix-turn-helix transcriptional regulator [Halocalculus aciditolerans]|uniref:HTH arsR-type domain-containing protein n=1 Tax=Halocalculus aciditolerans TaxID=1383812 RepID=A0A830F7S3_9EURY|nr:winged helix-turn-helix transcriptional regulator [Halocalculus aciditolerans]GGL71683.1 hypothetical protein GCM10009039_32180 [Halocalculus aciditolerans]
MAPTESENEEATDSPRESLLEYIQDHPGVYFSDLLRETDLARGQLSYHLRVLQEDDQILSVSRGGHKHFFPFNEFSQPAQVVLSVLTLDTPREILLLIYEEPGATRGHIAGAVGTTRQNVAWHLDRLVDAGLVHADKDGRAYHYYPDVDPELVRRLLETYHPSLWRTWSERLADTFDRMGTN